ncbi:MAG: mechanosensitive ion channel family protein [Rhodospirillales bacterium]|nr:mechanosensitive ion channel family protein [Rhodospirillales bacterium]
MEREIETVSKLVESIVEFLVAYGFQIVGALAFLGVGLLLANWVGKQVSRLAQAKNIDITLANFIGNVVKLVLIAFLAIITLGNFGITIAPLIALAGASAFGATLAIQGPLSNYGAGLSIVLSRPFVVGNTVSVRDTCGVVDEITLAATILVGEDGERIRIPNKDIVGRVIINSDTSRVVETKVFVAAGTDTKKAIDLLGETLRGFSEVRQDPAPQIGVHDFAYGGVILGMRFWVPSRKYFQTRYAVNGAALSALENKGIDMSTANSVAVAAPRLSSDSEDNA